MSENISNGEVNGRSENIHFSKFNYSILGGVLGGFIMALIGFAILVFLKNPYDVKPIFIEHDKSLIYNSEHLATNYDVRISSEMQMIFDKLKTQKVILTPHEYTSQLGSYYNSLIAVLVCLFVVFTLISFFSMKGIAKNDVKEAQLELDKKSAEINKFIKEEVKKVLDEMLRDSKLMHEKLDQSITGIINDAIEDAKSDFPSNETYVELNKSVINLREEQESLLNMYLEDIEALKNISKSVEIEDE